MESFEDGHVVSGAAHIGGAGQSGGTAADDRDPASGRRRDPGFGTFLRGFMVGYETFDAADRHGHFRVLPEFAHVAAGLALLFLRTDAAADRREQTLLTDDRQRAFEIAAGGGSEEIADRHFDRATFDARLVGALQTAVRFELSLRRAVAESNFLHIMTPHFGFLARHRLGFDRPPGLGGMVFLLQPGLEFRFSFGVQFPGVKGLVHFCCSLSFAAASMRQIWSSILRRSIGR